MTTYKYSFATPPKMDFLLPVVQKFADLNVDFAADWNWKDNPWWSNERASTGLFAAAVWLTKGKAFEEFSNEKKSRVKGKITGRSDLYFTLNGMNDDFVAEVKFKDVDGDKSNVAMVIQNCLEAAVRDVIKVKTEEKERKLALVFFYTYFRIRSDVNGISDERINQFNHRLSVFEKECLVYFRFPEEARAMRWKDKKYFNPGFGMVIKEIINK